MDVKTHWNSTREILKWVYRVWEFTCEGLHKSKYTEYRPLFTTQDEWMIVKYNMGVLRPFRYCTLRMSKSHTVTLHHVITVYNDLIDHMDGVMRALAKKKTQWKEDLFFRVKLARQKLCEYYAEVIPTMGMLPISAHVFHHFRKLRSFGKWGKGMDINSEDETFYSTKYQETILKYAENEYCTKHQFVPINKLQNLPSSNPISSAMASGSCQSSFDAHDLSRDDQEYLMPNNVAVTTPR